MDTEQKQVILTGVFGDGHITKPETSTKNSFYKTSCKHKEYLDYKKFLLKELYSCEGFVLKNGYSQTSIYTLNTKRNTEITIIGNQSLEDSLNSLNELGIALWIYDDGSMHKTRLFYNLNTQYFSKEVQEDFFIPFFNKYNIFPKITKEVKKDGRTFFYLRIDIHDGAFEVNELLRKYPISCYNYKVWPEKYYKFYKELKDKGLNKKEIKTFIKVKTSKNNHLKKK